MSYQIDTTDWALACPRTYWTPGIKRVWTYDGSPGYFQTKEEAETEEAKDWGNVVPGPRGTICG